MQFSFHSIAQTGIIRTKDSLASNLQIRSQDMMILLWQFYVN
jgi:hypothetical protein